MQQIVFNKELQEVAKKLRTGNREFTNNDYLPPDRKIEVNWGKLSKEEVAELLAVIERESLNGSVKAKHYARIAKKVHDWISLSTGVSGGTLVKKLELLPAALKGYFEEAKHKWVFIQQRDGALTPYFFEKAEYRKGYMSQGYYNPPRAWLTLKAYSRGSGVTLTFEWYSSDLPNTVEALLAQHGGYRETDEAVSSYQEAFKKYCDLQASVGLQMQAIGMGTSVNGNSWRSGGLVSFVRDGIPAKVVVDDGSEEHSENRVGSRSSGSRIINNDYWSEIPNLNGMVGMDVDGVMEDEGTGPREVHLPIHPYVKVFDLGKDQWALIHTDNLNEYPWDKELGDKLVLKKADKDLISLLVNQTGTQVDDIVRGKMAGVIVLATGEPGIGKTLTAEVFSEMIEKPLYTVQCSQLGLDVRTIESNLEEILIRAARWGAILLVDEADVYIRRRGDDIQQNAIVGVFLRLLEYYRGVIFMTSNRGDEIDDAILSRATAWIKYEKPDEVMLREIWKILGKQYGAEFSDVQVGTLVQKLPGISGRTVRNLLKLARMLVGPGGEIDYNTIKLVANYQMIN